MTFYDYLIIGVYLLFMVGLGISFKKFSADASDFFRGGGSMMWWMCGASAFMTAFSAWSFTGAAGKVYETGLLPYCLYLANFIGYLITWRYFSYRFRQMRVTTYVEAIRDRFGKSSEQFFTWVSIPLGLILGGIGLNAVSIFVSSAMEIDFSSTVIVLGFLITCVAVSGGAWAVVASDFIQMLLIFSIALVAAYLALREPQIGGLHGLLDKAPSEFFNWGELAQPRVIIFWIVAIFLNQFIAINNMGEAAARYLMVKDSQQARWASLIPMIGILVAPLVWFIPSMASRIMYPDLSIQFPDLANPNEAAYVAVCLQTMPQGMIGLMICAIFAATLSTMDSGLNRNAGIFVLNFYKPYIDPEAGAARILLVSRLTTCFFGVFIVVFALAVMKWQTIGLFDLVLRIVAAVIVPMSIPMLFSVFHRSAPDHVAWSTAIIGMTMSLLIPFLVQPESLVKLMGVEGPLNSREITDGFYVFNIFLVVGVCSLWYWGASLLTPKLPGKRAVAIQSFYQQMNTPVVQIDGRASLEGEVRQYRVLSALCIIYGGLLSLGSAIPNSMSGRLCFIFVGGFVASVGLILRYAGKRTSNKLSNYHE